MSMSAMMIKSPVAARVVQAGARRCISSTAVRLADKQETEEIKPEFYIPRAERSGRSVFVVDDTLGEDRLARSNRLEPTRELNFTPDHWRKHKDPYRRIRHVVNMLRSSPVQRLMFPDLASVAAISAALAYYNEFIAASEATQLSISMNGFAGATTAIGLLAGFRLNASYGRYEECRIFWGDTNNTIRDMAGQTMMWMKDRDQRCRMLKLLKAYPVVLNFHLNAKGGHHNIERVKAGVSRTHAGDSVMQSASSEDIKPQASFADRVHAEFKAELRDIYLDGKDENDYKRICDVKYAGGNTSLEVLTLMRETIAGSVGTVEGIYVRELDEQCQRLCASYGASERVLRTPLPTGFTRHSSRLMLFWSSALPFALYPAMGPLGTLPAAVFTSFAILGIEDIGVQLEEPFDILPMRQYSDGMFDAISMVEKNYTPYIPPSIAPDVAAEIASHTQTEPVDELTKAKAA